MRDFEEYGAGVAVWLDWVPDDFGAIKLLEFNYEQIKERVFPKWTDEPKFDFVGRGIVFSEGLSFRLVHDGETPDGKVISWRARVPREFILDKPPSEYELMKSRQEKEFPETPFPWTEAEFNALMAEES